MAVLRRRHREPSPEGTAFRAVFDEFSDADHPVGFGPGQRWMAARTNRPKQVAELLDAAVGPSRWGTGVARAGDDGRVFVTPPVDGWVLVPGYQPIADDLAALSTRLGQAQAFVANAGGGELAWELWRGGEVVRRVRVRETAPGRPAIEEVGPATDGERAAGVPGDLSGGFSEFSDRLVLAVAGTWSVDPSTLDDRLEPQGPGWLGRVVRYPVARNAFPG